MGEERKEINEKMLDYSHREMDVLPSISQLSVRPCTITHINVSGNRFRSLPSEILQFTNLSTLDVSSNQLEHLPREISKMIKLETLLVQNNFLEECWNTYISEETLSMKFPKKLLSCIGKILVVIEFNIDVHYFILLWLFLYLCVISYCHYHFLFHVFII